MSRKQLRQYNSYFTYQRQRSKIELLVYFMILVVAVILTVVLVVSAGKIDLTTLPQLEYFVKPQDTLWGIATMYKPDSVNIQYYVYRLRELNKITPELYPGQKIIIFDGRNYQ